MRSQESSSLRPTEEQEAILNASGRIVRINARAGTGKTTTLKMLADRFHSSRIIYIVFNKRASHEAKQKFPNHVEVRTVHSLAYGSVREGHNWELKEDGSFVIDLLPKFRNLRSKQQILSALTYEFLKYFLNSTHNRLEEAIEPFVSRYLSDEQRRDFSAHVGQVVSVSRDITGDWYHGRARCPHDFYLKLSHREGKLPQRLNQFDVVLVDEGQDLSFVMLDALRKCHKRIFLVGDSHQQIYEFRYAIDAMRNLKCDQELELSLSFRFGERIARLVSRFIQEMKDLQGFRVRGNRKKPSQVFLLDGNERSSMKLDRETAILSRTNLGLFETAVELHERRIPCYFARDIEFMLFRALDVFRLSQGEREKIRDPFLGTFESLEQLREYAEAMEDYPRLQLIKIVEQHRDEMPGLIFELHDSAKRSRERDPKDSVILSTVHSAKGEEYRTVILHEDIGYSLGRALEDGAKKLDEEVNITYVAMTRAIENLYLPMELKGYVAIEWKGLLSEAKSIPRRTMKHSVPSKPRPGKGSDKRFRVGQRVRTCWGTGKIVEVSPDGKYLVNLDHQPARVWERASGLERDD